MTFTLHGLPVSGGIAIGHAHLVSHAMLDVAHYAIQPRKVDDEVQRLARAFDTVRAELAELRSSLTADSAEARGELLAFIDLHSMILDDPLLLDEACAFVRERRCNAEWAVKRQMDRLVEQFEEIEDPYLRSRSADVVQVVERVIKALSGKRARLSTRRRDTDSIIVAHDLSPADTIQFKAQRIAAFVTDLGGATSHTAIVARSLAIPALVGMHHARSLIQDDDMLIVDGLRGVLIINPDDCILDEYRLRAREIEIERSKLKRLAGGAATTLDGEDVQLYANIELPQDVDQVREVEADGIGLFRTEFMFLNRDSLPDEDEQFEAYRSVVQAMKGKPVTLRTLDIGADKALRGAERSEANPALGLRAIRYCLAEPRMFVTQLRAILRASHYGRVRILLPMVAFQHEIESALAMIALARQQLREAGRKYDERVEIGAMVEIPAAALALGTLMNHFNFLSIGTNDLIQYTLAIDRADEAVAYLYDPLHPSVLRLVQQCIQQAKRAGMPIAVCGEMAGEPQFTRLLLGMGLRQFSMHPSQLLEVKREVLRCDCGDVAPRVIKLLRSDDPMRIREQLERINAGSTPVQ
ncbi:MAG: phosphoenolpyruvate--protein phosphotransferase [Gammaproteobacteria bacterium]|nr:phosphoenolpyruvate--protein phosphotransferase [Gammaproteobacteria bacterium]MBU0771338.1 phosphoenolpyruvate--protein phosphotransferase [Gammaproteobacteria bacterium]MBU0857146.1 phosphoenolpyruvate--protein phosphotransferase [Gammaproteobacteria bacterium]MBU1848024.1 phosphoenolpyruvate--protein phosphotransferase [Gammaproteobacteria bacterium]